jgi:hypothetical protein
MDVRTWLAQDIYSGGGLTRLTHPNRIFSTLLQQLIGSRFMLEC